MIILHPKVIPVITTATESIKLSFQFICHIHSFHSFEEDFLVTQKNRPCSFEAIKTSLFVATRSSFQDDTRAF